MLSPTQEEEPPVQPVSPIEFATRCIEVLSAEDPTVYHLLTDQRAAPCKAYFCCPVKLETSLFHTVPPLEFVLVQVIALEEGSSDTYLSYTGHSSILKQEKTLVVIPGATNAQRKILIEEELTVYWKYASFKVLLLNKPLFDVPEPPASDDAPQVVTLKRDFEDFIADGTALPQAREQVAYSPQRARHLIERSMKALAPEPECLLMIDDFFCFLRQELDIFRDNLNSFFSSERKGMNKNNLSGVAFQCIEWASVRLQMIQSESLLAFMSNADHSTSPITTFVGLYQPLENFILSEIHDDLMEALTLQYQTQEKEFQAKTKAMRANPFTHQPSEISPELRRISLKNAERELNFITTEKGRTPIQKLLCLKTAFINLETALLLAMAPPPNPAPRPDQKDDRRRAERFDLDLQWLNGKGHESDEYDERKRRLDVMNLVLLLLINHAPPNFRAHLDFIMFHTINDATSACMQMYYQTFLASWNLLMSCVPQKAILSLDSPRRERLHVSYSSFIWGLVNGQIESFPVLCKSLMGQQIISIKCGQKHIIALTKNGTVLTFGKGDEGQLGHGDERDKYDFEEVSLLETQGIRQIEGGGSHSAAISSSGKLFCWGGNLWGQIGMGFTCDYVPIPKQVEFNSPTYLKVQKVSCGAAHNLALLADGSVWSWGMGANGRLGHGDESNKDCPTRIRRFNLKDSDQIIDIACGWNHSICVSSSGDVYAFGCGSDGQLGLGDYRDQIIPQKIPYDFGGLISCTAFNHTMVLTQKGEVYSWGWGEHGELGHGDTFTRCSPQKVLFEKEALIQIIACGAFHSAAVTKEGVLYTWGNGEHGTLGHGDYSTQTTPYQVGFLSCQRTIEISCGFSQTIAVIASLSQRNPINRDTRAV